MSGKALYGDNQYNVLVTDGNSFDGFDPAGDITSGCLVFVYDAGTKTAATIYSDGKRTSLANPITRSQFASDGAIKFYGAASSYDVTIAHSDGSVAVHTGVTPNTKRLPLSRATPNKCIVFPMVFNSGGTETDTGLDLPAGVWVHDIAVEVLTVDATETVDVGLLSSESGGDADGFCVALSVATAGMVKPWINTTGSNETYVSTAKYGVFMGPSIVGTDVDKDIGNPRGYGHYSSAVTAKSISYTPSTSDTFVGYGYIYFRHMR